MVHSAKSLAFGPNQLVTERNFFAPARHSADRLGTVNEGDQPVRYWLVGELHAAHVCGYHRRGDLGFERVRYLLSKIAKDSRSRRQAKNQQAYLP